MKNGLLDLDPDPYLYQNPIYCLFSESYPFAKLRKFIHNFFFLLIMLTRGCFLLEYCNTLGRSPRSILLYVSTAFNRGNA